jgi:mycothiol synthase
VIVRPAAAADSAEVSEICATALRTEPDAREFPAILAGASPDRVVTAVAEMDGRVVGVGYASTRLMPGGTIRGHVDLIAVAPGWRRHGAGTRLLSELEAQLLARGAAEVRLGHNAPVYLWPGVDRTFKSMISLAERAGYEQYDEAVNLVADLREEALDTVADERELAAAGISVRRAAPADGGPLGDWLRAGPWGASSWPAEVAAAVSHEPAGCHIACRGSEYVAFACHGVNRSGWFGPMGTSGSERRHGIGTVLLRRCLADIRSAGHQTAQIAWAGPVRYYERAVGARVDRVFWLFGKPLTAPSPPAQPDPADA